MTWSNFTGTCASSRRCIASSPFESVLAMAYDLRRTSASTEPTSGQGGSRSQAATRRPSSSVVRDGTRSCSANRAPASIALRSAPARDRASSRSADTPVVWPATPCPPLWRPRRSSRLEQLAQRLNEGWNGIKECGVDVERDRTNRHGEAFLDPGQGCLSARRNATRGASGDGVSAWPSRASI